MVEGVPFDDVHATLVSDGIPHVQAFTTAVRVFRSGGLTKDAVYLRGLLELIDHLSTGGDLDTLLLGKMPLTAVPLVGDLHRAGPAAGRRSFVLATSTTRSARDRLARLAEVRSPVELIGEAA